MWTQPDFSVLHEKAGGTSGVVWSCTRTACWCQGYTVPKLESPGSRARGWHETVKARVAIQHKREVGGSFLWYVGRDDRFALGDEFPFEGAGVGGIEGVVVLLF